VLGPGKEHFRTKWQREGSFLSGGPEMLGGGRNPAMYIITSSGVALEVVRQAKGGHCLQGKKKSSGFGWVRENILGRKWGVSETKNKNLPGGAGTGGNSVCVEPIGTTRSVSKKRRGILGGGPGLRSRLA